MSEDVFLQGQGGFFGRRKGKKLRSRQAELVDDLLPRLRIDRTGPVDPAALFPRPVSDVRLEIGFGGGEHLLAEAVAHPGIGHIGCEPFVNGMAKLLAAVDERGLDNVRLHDEDAIALIDRMPDASVGRVVMLYPDPWPKRRHHKRRLLSDETLARFARILRPGGEFRFASDIDHYVGWTLARILRSPDFDWTAERAEDWRRPWAGWPGTRYEAKAIREGRTPCYITAIRR